MLQSASNPAVHAAGDSAGIGPPLTPVAGRDGEVVARNLRSGDHRKPDYRGVPSVTFTAPPIASVGSSEAAARARRRHLRVPHERAPGWYTARQAEEAVYGHETLVDDDTVTILGADLVGPHAAGVVRLFALVMRRHNPSASQIRDSVFIYPTAASDVV